MSEQVTFVVYYGSGNVRQTVMGADLSEFAYVEIPLMDPEKASIRWFEYYLTVNFGLDPEEWTFRVKSFWTKSREEIFWELLPINRNQQWVAWLESCKRRGTNPVALITAVPNQQNVVQSGVGYETGQSSQTTHEMDVSGSGPGDQSYYVPHTGGGYEAEQSSESDEQHEYSGEADGDEVGGVMQDLIAEEDEDGEREDLDSDDSNEGDDWSEEDDEDSEKENRKLKQKERKKLRKRKKMAVKNGNDSDEGKGN